MNKQIYRFSNSLSNRKLRKAFLENPELAGELIDASVCNGVASKLYILRKAEGITQQELAEKLGVKQSNISRWETPGYQGYKVKMLSRIARALNGRLTIDIKPLHTYYFELNFTNALTISENSVQVNESSKSKSFSNEKKEIFENVRIV